MNGKKKISIYSFLTVLLITISLLGMDGIAYLYALHLEKTWTRVDPKTKSELEECLHCYFCKSIDPSQSDWGCDYKLKENERMIRYMILYFAHLDVVFDSGDKIMAIFTSYE